MVKVVRNPSPVYQITQQPVLEPLQTPTTIHLHSPQQLAGAARSQSQQGTTGVVPRNSNNNNNNNNNNNTGCSNFGNILRKCKKEPTVIKENKDEFLSLFSESTTYLDVLKIFDKAVHEGNYHIGTECLHRLIAYANVDNALKIYVVVFKLCAKPELVVPSGSHAPSAPPLPCLEDKVDQPEFEPKFFKPLSNLYRKLMQLILNNGDCVLAQKEVEDLTFEDAYFFLTNDDLIISREIVVYLAICRWFKATCARRNIEKARCSFKDVLGLLAYAPRYGMMSKKEFLVRKIDKFPGPYRMGFLTEEVSNCILLHIKDCELRGHSERYLINKMSQPRNQYKQRSHDSSNNNDNLDRRENVALLRCLACWSAVFD